MINLGTSEERTVSLGEGALTIGRTPECEVIAMDRSLSRRHARVECLNSEVFVEDLGSHNGTWVNGERVSRKRLWPGDVVQCGAVRLALVEGPQRNRFLATIGHELCPPLEAVIVCSARLQEEAGELGFEGIEPDLLKVQGAARDLLSLIDDIRTRFDS